MITPPWLRRAGLVAAGALATTAPVLMAEYTADDGGRRSLEAIAAAGAWRDVLDAHRAPQLPPPGETESAIVILDGAPVVDHPEGERESAFAELALRQATVEPSLLGLGATVNFRYRVLANGFGIRVPTGRLSLVSELPGVKAVYPVTYLAPAQGSVADPAPQPLPGTQAAAAPGPAAGRPATIALIDAGVQADHPWLGGGIGPDRLIVGGADFVSGNPTPQASPDARFAEAHGTELAALVLRSPALEGLEPARVPRMLVYRVVAREFVDGRVRALARTDRVLAAMERAVDPNLDGRLDDRAAVLLLGLARGMDGAGVDPVAAAAARADAAGSLVVAPAGNDGPTFGDVGTIAGPAASERVLTVGGITGGRGPRTATLELAVGPAASRLAGLPLMGGAPPPDPAPIVVLAGTDGLTRGDDVRDYADALGRSRVQGAIAVVGRGGGTIPQKARAAAQAGAAALAVWDQDGPGLFPGIGGGPDIPIAVIGLGARQGQVLVDHPGFSGRITEADAADADRAIPSFSSRGPTAEGALEPDLVAPAVDVETAFPGSQGEALTARMTGTSAAAAAVAAIALRARIDRPELAPADIRSLLVQAAEPLAGVPLVDQGAGVARAPGAFPLTFAPAVVSAVRRAGAPTRARVTVHDVGGAGGTYRAALAATTGETLQVAEAVTLAPGGRAEIDVPIPAGEGTLTGTLHLIDPSGASAGIAPVFAAPAPRLPPTVLRAPEVRAVGDSVEARVTIGLAEPVGTALVVAPLHRVGLWLVPAGGGAPVRMTGARETGDWPAGTYRFVLTRRRADGKELAAGRYRLRVAGTAAGGRAVVRESRVFRLR